MTEVESPKADLRQRGHVDGAALVARGEGIWWGDGGALSDRHIGRADPEGADPALRPPHPTKVARARRVVRDVFSSLSKAPTRRP